MLSTLVAGVSAAMMYLNGTMHEISNVELLNHNKFSLSFNDYDMNECLSVYMHCL